MTATLEVVEIRPLHRYTQWELTASVCGRIKARVISNLRGRFRSKIVSHERSACSKAWAEVERMVRGVLGQVSVMERDRYGGVENY